MSAVSGCLVCNGRGWLLMAGGFAIRGTSKDLATILASIRKRESSGRQAIEMGVQRCDECRIYKDDDEAKENATLMFEVHLSVVFEVNGYVTSDDLMKTISENGQQALDAAVNNDTDFIDLITRVSVVGMGSDK